ncbi:hypothetical protein NDN08_002348 [Rhodosorus marinus]|uniref:B box-type domain-containing protein n=1 Tax=Rhodosorus marinus TaxID=101924 RepID=A0AAV8UXK3_9RHOD|nr:hypothetical protein NDN08_002348 [Rhodosorus marinus]
MEGLELKLDLVEHHGSKLKTSKALCDGCEKAQAVFWCLATSKCICRLCSLSQLHKGCRDSGETLHRELKEGCVSTIHCARCTSMPAEYHCEEFASFVCGGCRHYFSEKCVKISSAMVEYFGFERMDFTSSVMLQSTRKELDGANGSEPRTKLASSGSVDTSNRTDLSQKELNGTDGSEVAPQASSPRSNDSQNGLELSRKELNGVSGPQNRTRPSGPKGRSD